MNVKDILNLNKQFYQLIAEEFSISRQKPWKGWEAIGKIIDIEFEKKKKINVLDIGSGNGRFYDFLKKARFNNLSINYTGIDINDEFLKEAEQKHGKGLFEKKDIFLEINRIRKKFDVVTGFGITHHLPKGSFSNKWFKNLSKLVKKNGLLVLTFWNFSDKPGKYLVSWKNKPSVSRFCRKYSKREINGLIKMYKRKGFELLDRFESDRKNEYIILKKRK